MSEEQTEPRVEKEAIKPQVVPQSVALKDGALAPANASELVRTIKQIAAGGGFPERFDTEQKQIAAYNLAHSLMGGNWQIALNNIAIIKGAMCIYGELPGAIAEQTKEVAEKKVYCVDAEYNEICTGNKNLGAEPFAGVCVIQRKGREKKEFTYTLAEATKAGQYPSGPHSPWTKFTKIMLMRKAMGMAIKFEFPDALCGAPIAEYDFDEAPDLKDVTPNNASNNGDRAKDLNSRFSGSEDAIQ